MIYLSPMNILPPNLLVKQPLPFLRFCKKNHDFKDLVTRYAPEGKPMYQIVEELAEDNEYFAEVFILQMNACFLLYKASKPCHFFLDV